MARKFRGTEAVKVDAKGRMSIPAKFRRVFEAGDPDFQNGGKPQIVIVYGPEDWQMLHLYTIEAADEIDAEIDRLPRASLEREWLEELMNGQADTAEIDTEGRLVLPQKLRQKIGIEDGAILTARGDKLVLWANEETSEAHKSRLAEYQQQHGPGFDPLSLAGQVGG
ncbi:MAG: division/cell wall cluster transcriptional repressor MraZ [Paracoccus sp. (in: a-proteobacteria)]|nr:division/cell wall cluster transcriptional repressor MraZ [Paracoccus sp. (in: a-proteobacteria)]